MLDLDLNLDFLGYLFLLNSIIRLQKICNLSKYLFLFLIFVTRSICIDESSQ